MRGLLVRVGVDQAYGGWNAPVDPTTFEFAYVPIPDGAQQQGLATPYTEVLGALARFPGVQLPEQLRDRMMHLDPDFERLTYGDNGARRGRGVAALEPGDFIAFFASLHPTKRVEQTLIYALIGFFRVSELVWAGSVPARRWGENAHTRRLKHSHTDVIVRADPSASGRLRRCIPIGEWRNRSYRVRQDLLDEWGHLSCRDGFIQRSAVPPSFLEPTRFLTWFEGQHADLVAANNPKVSMKTLVYKRTHNGDPDVSGQFGIRDCMKTVRAWGYEAVIGVGGTGPEPRRKGIAEKLTWVGIGPHRTGRPDRPLVTFDHFLYFAEDGPRLDSYAPSLASHIYGRNVRTLMSFTGGEQAEVDRILALAKDAPPSKALAGQRGGGRAASMSCKAQVPGQGHSGRSC